MAEKSSLIVGKFNIIDIILEQLLFLLILHRSALKNWFGKAVETLGLPISRIETKIKEKISSVQ